MKYLFTEFQGKPINAGLRLNLIFNHENGSNDSLSHQFCEKHFHAFFITL